ncbi:hypothetical protein [Aquabacterium humicola]|uniref:hypothetical protein n=1 Tax=Aquabacterium humicola TaxID=3237377 RepID=UPI0025429245|nr:hypothetical protein [Rubrivivax pictus]
MRCLGPGALALLLAVLPAAAARADEGGGASRPPAAGRYTGRVGSVPSSTRAKAALNTLEISRPAAGGFQLRIHLEWAGGHLCDLSGPAQSAPDGSLRYTEAVASGPACELRVRSIADDLVLSDERAACRRLYCGNRAGFDGVRFSVRSRRPN